MRFKQAFPLLILATPLFYSISGCGSLRDRLKERWIEKQGHLPPPASVEAPEKITTAGDFTFSIKVRDSLRYYKVHVPLKYSPDVMAPLLFVLHGGGGDMTIQSNDDFYKQISKSESEGFIAVFPNGESQFPSGKLATWNAGKCCGFARDSKVDDVEFMKQVLQRMQTQLSIHPRRIFVTGMSNGGMMAYRLACEMSGTFRAIVSVAGTDNTESCTPSQPISILHIHAKDDDHVLFAGGAGKGAFRDRTQVTEFTSVPETLKKWRELDACKETPMRVLEKPGAYCEVSVCRYGTKVQLCVTESGGHSWPGGKKPRAGAGAQPSTAISANDVMWEFFKSLD